MELKTGSAKSTVFWSLCIMGGFMILSSTMSKAGAVLDSFASNLGTPIEWSGLIVSASTIPGILISFPAASLSDIFGRKKFLLFAGFVFASAPFLYLFIMDWYQLILVRFYHGFATAIFVPVAEASIAELFPAKVGERISLFTSATYVGRIIAPTLGAYILIATNSSRPYRNFQDLYLAVGVVAVTGLVMALPFLVKKSEPRPASQKKAGETVRKLFFGWRELISNGSTLIVSIIQASQYYVFGAFDFYLTDYLTKALGYSILIPGLVQSCVIGVAIFARPLMGRVSDKIGRRIPIIFGCALSALPLIAIPYVTDFTILILLAIIYGIGFAAVTSSTSPLISEIVPKELLGTSMGFLATMMDVGQTIGPIVSGMILATSLHHAGVFLAFAVVLLSSCVIFVSSGVDKRRLKKT